jgi:hypothetical protein
MHIYGTCFTCTTQATRLVATTTHDARGQQRSMETQGAPARASSFHHHDGFFSVISKSIYYDTFLFNRLYTRKANYDTKTISFKQLDPSLFLTCIVYARFVVRPPFLKLSSKCRFPLWKQVLVLLLLTDGSVRYLYSICFFSPRARPENRSHRVLMFVVD